MLTHRLHLSISLCPMSDAQNRLLGNLSASSAVKTPSEQPISQTLIPEAEAAADQTDGQTRKRAPSMIEGIVPFIKR